MDDFLEVDCVFYMTSRPLRVMPSGQGSPRVPHSGIGERRPPWAEAWISPPFH